MCLFPSPSSLREAGSLLWTSGGPPKAEQGRGLACGFRAVRASRLPATPFPACLRRGPPRSPTPALGSAAARPRDCSSPRLPLSPARVSRSALVRARGPSEGRSLLCPPLSLLRGLKRGSNPAPSRWLLCSFVSGGSPSPRCGSLSGTRAAAAASEGWGSGVSRRAGKVADLMRGEHVWAAAALLVTSNSLFSSDPLRLASEIEHLRFHFCIKIFVGLEFFEALTVSFLSAGNCSFELRLT